MSTQPLSANAIRVYTHGLSSLKDEFQKETKLTNTTLSDYLSRLSTYDCLLNGAPRVISNLSELAAKKLLPDQLPNLRSIDLSNISDTDLQVLFSKAGNLVEIVLRENEDRDFQWLNTCKLAGLMIFRIPNSPLFNNGHLTSVISMTDSLRLLNISGCQAIDSKALALISIACPNLLYLDISDTAFDLDQALDNSLPFPKVRFFEIANCTTLSKTGMKRMPSVFPMLVYFNASGTGLNDEELIFFGEKYKTSIIRIDLARCKSISDAAISKITLTCQGLRAINLTGCDAVTKKSIDEAQIFPNLKIASSIPGDKDGVQIICD